jgi:hypothetical protein
MACKMKNAEWNILTGFMGLVDFIQILIDFIVGPGEVFNEIADAVIGLLLGAYLWFRGAMSSNAFWSIIASFVAGEFTAGVLAFWFLDVIVARAKVVEAQVIQTAESKVAKIGGPVNQGGRREPRSSQQPPLNTGGKRSPINVLK